MSTNIKHAKTATNYTPLESGTYPAVCCGVIDIGLQKNVYDGKDREINQIIIVWELPGETIEVDGENKPRWLSNTYTFSVHEKAKLRKDLKSWRGRDFTDEELTDFDIVKVIGAPCVITVSQETKNGHTYSNITGIGKAMKGMVIPLPSKKLYFDMDNKDTWACFPDLPEWIRRKINDSLTLHENGIQIDKDGKIADVEKTPAAEPGFSELTGDDDGDLPF